jgi:hypothetical protein
MREVKNFKIVKSYGFYGGKLNRNARKQRRLERFTRMLYN